ncbi:MAG: hypothetical protein WED09_10830 [Homoserinimonas sp.]
MTIHERSRQQLDPIGTFGNNLTTILFTMSAFGVAAVLVAASFDQIANPPLAVVGLLLLGVSCVYLVFASNPIRAPFTRRAMTSILLTALVASGLELASEWGEPRMAISGWGPIALGLLILSTGPYRPPREIAAAGSIVAVFYGFLTVVHAGSSPASTPVLAIVAASVMPILALAYATAAHSTAVVHGLERWRRKVMRPGRVVSKDDEDGIARSVQQDRVTILNREVLPFFLEIIEKPAVSNRDRERARDIAASVRKVMVAEVDRSWLEHAVDQLTAMDQTSEPDADAEPLIRDDDHVANHMSYDQRTALRAFIVALHDGSKQKGEFAKIELFRDGGVFRAVMVSELEIADFAVRSRFAPYFAVLRVMFTDLRLEYLHGVLTLSFCYEQR